MGENFSGDRRDLTFRLRQMFRLTTFMWELNYVESLRWGLIPSLHNVIKETFSSYGKGRAAAGCLVPTNSLLHRSN